MPVTYLFPMLDPAALFMTETCQTFSPL